MTSRELRTQRREAERKARKLEYQQSRAAAAEICGDGSLAGEPVARPADFTPGERSSSALALNPDLLDEFSAGDLGEMMAIRARVHARARIADLPQESAPSERTGPTGPRSPEGKATSSGNSLKHGLASGRIIVPGEDPADFEALLADLVAEHAPATETESLLVQQMAQSWWLMQRAIRLQNDAFTESRVDTHKLALFLRYQTTHERAFYRALNLLMKLQKEHRKSAPEFVSRKRHQPRQAPEFVSQNRPHTPLPNQFVSQTSTPPDILRADS